MLCIHCQWKRLTPFSCAPFRSRHCRVVTRLHPHPFASGLRLTISARVNNSSGRDAFYILFFEPPVDKLPRRGSYHQQPAILLCRRPGETTSPWPFFVLVHPSLDPNPWNEKSQASPLGPQPRAHSPSERHEVRTETRDSCVMFWIVPFCVRRLRRAQEVRQLAKPVAHLPHRRSSDPRFHQS